MAAELHIPYFVAQHCTQNLHRSYIYSIRCAIYCMPYTVYCILCAKDPRTRTHRITGRMFARVLEAALPVPREFPGHRLLRARFISALHRLVEALQVCGTRCAWLF